MLWLHALASWWLVGVGVTVTLVQYPTFRDVAADRFVSFHARHATGMTQVVAVPWLTQGVTAVLLVTGSSGPAAQLVAVASAVAVLITVVAIIPAHSRLSRGFDETAFVTLTRFDRLRLVAFLAPALAATVVAWRG